MPHDIPRAAPRLAQLDVLRGLAALVVVFNHYVQTVPEPVRQLAAYPGGLMNPEAWLTPWPWLRATPLRLAVAGEAAVDLFFVLSGFVLMYSVTAAAQPGTLAFLVRRFCRVYLPFAAVILATVLAYRLFPPMPAPGSSAWLSGLLTEAAAAMARLPGHLLMTGEAADMQLNPVMWTLVHEMRVSLALPLVFLAIRRWGVPRVLLPCLVVSVLASLGMEDSISGSWQATVHFFWMFVLGAGLSYHRQAIGCALARRRPLLRGALVGVALLLMASPWSRVWSDFLMAAGAAMLIVSCLPEGRAVRAIRAPALVWLGRVSYSLYLVHLPVMIVVASLWGDMLLLSFVLALLLAQLIYHGAELPSHRLGLWLTAGRGREATARAGAR